MNYVFGHDPVYLESFDTDFDAYKPGTVLPRMIYGPLEWEGEYLIPLPPADTNSRASYCAVYRPSGTISYYKLVRTSTGGRFLGGREFMFSGIRTAVKESK